MDDSLSTSLPLIAISQSFTAFVVIAILLTELKILNTDIGRLAMSAAMFADIIGFVFTAFLFATIQNKDGTMVTLLGIILSTVALCVGILYVMRPLILRIIKQSSDGRPVSQTCIVCIFLFVLITGFFSELIGQHYIMGPLILGLVIPVGPPLGTALITKMETISYDFFYPIFLAISGLQTDVFKIEYKSMWIVCIIVVVSVVVKIGAVMLPGYYNNVPLKECFVIGLILNARGVVELVSYNLWKGGKLMSDQEFSLSVISIIVVNAIIAPLIRLIYDPSKQYQHINRSSIQHSRRDSEFRIMVCIHKNENIPTMIDLLEASYASEESSVAVIALILKELLGRARPLLIAHQPHETLRVTSSKSTQINNSLNQYAQQNKGYAYLESFTSISNYETMNHDVCQIAFDRGANILILPFHKQWQIDGSVNTTNKAIQNMNMKVLERAPCSVGILVDRGILGGSGSVSHLFTKPIYHVGVFFIGGADDAEALAYSSRMCRHKSVNVKVIRFLQFGSENSIDRRRESDIIDEYRHLNYANRRFETIDELIRDGVDMSLSIRKLIETFDLVIVGREHPKSSLFEGYEEWSECPELGILGDMLASQDFVTKASVLVVQQHRPQLKLLKHKVCPLPNDRDSFSF
ncbi:Sodium/solute symporter superfamily [Sesbania bispinosa]|nr:Sodium/solute symporter superfamily [Sesbania bispinosa]